MIERTYAEYRHTLRRLGLAPRTVLEVGARPDATSLLACPELVGAARRTGVNLYEAGSFGSIEVLRMDARALDFADDSFDLVLCASTLEHVPDFWRASDEMKRVLAPGGTLLISVPGYTESPLGNRLRDAAFRFRLPDWCRRGTWTMRIHDAPHDYYRFSEYALREVLLGGLEAVDVWSIMTPPRMYGSARKAATLQ